jgi:hypothetical protein
MVGDRRSDRVIILRRIDDRRPATLLLWHLARRKWGSWISGYISEERVSAWEQILVWILQTPGGIQLPLNIPLQIGDWSPPSASLSPRKGCPKCNSLTITKNRVLTVRDHGHQVVRY